MRKLEKYIGSCIEVTVFPIGVGELKVIKGILRKVTRNFIMVEGKRGKIYEIPFKCENVVGEIVTLDGNIIYDLDKEENRKRMRKLMRKLKRNIGEKIKVEVFWGGEEKIIWGTLKEVKSNKFIIVENESGDCKIPFEDKNKDITISIIFSKGEAIYRHPNGTDPTIYVT